MIALAVALAVVVAALLVRVGFAMWRDRREPPLPLEWRNQQARSRDHDAQ